MMFISKINDWHGMMESDDSFEDSEEFHQVAVKFYLGNALVND